MALDAVSARAPARPRSPLRRREFRLYFAGNLTSNIGNWINNVVLAVYMFELTHSSLWVGVVGLGLGAPVLAFALPAGVLADRYDRLRLMRAAQAGACALAALLTVLVATGSADRYVIAAVALGFGAATAFAIPTLQSLIPILVPPEELPDALRMNGLTFNIARVLGPVLAAATLASLGAVWAFALNAVSFVPLIVALTLIRRPPFPRAATGEPGPIREGIRYAWRHLRTRALLLAVVAVGVTLDPITTLSPALAQGYGIARGGAGWIVASWGGGAVLTLVLGRRAIRAVTEHGLVWLGLLVLAAGMAALGAAPSFAVAVPAGLLTGAGYIVTMMASSTMIQRDVPESLRGRVSALWTLAFLGPRFFASVADGALADAVGARVATASFAIVALVAAAFMRRVEAVKGEPVHPPA
jgi:MFS family permease